MKNTLTTLIISFIIIVVSIIACDYAKENSDTFGSIFEVFGDILRKIVRIYPAIAAIAMSIALIEDLINKALNLLSSF